MALQRVSTSLPIMHARDPIAKQNLVMTKRTHQQITHNNTPDMVSRIQRAPHIVHNDSIVLPPPRQSLRKALPTLDSTTVTFSPIPGRRLPITRAQIISQTALHAFLTKEALFTNQAFIPRGFKPPANIGGVPDFAYVASPVVHPVTGETILSYKQLMHDPATKKI